MVNEDKYSAITVSILSVILVLVTNTLFHNQLSEAQEGSLQVLETKADLLNYGNSYYEQGEYQEAITWFDKALEIDPNYVFALHNKGLALIQLGQYEEAITSLDKALAIEPSNVNVLNDKDFALDKLRK